MRTAHGDADRRRAEGGGADDGADDGASGASPWRARPSAGLRGRVAAPGDKSISHRALILGLLAEGATRIDGLLESEDVLNTARAVRALGARAQRAAPGSWSVIGSGRPVEPSDVLDCGNSGTAARLLLGAVAGSPITAIVTGDASLRGRPMRRVLEPLERMGARWLAREGERLPLALSGGSLAAIEHRPAQASAQVKSAVLLAGLNAAGDTRVIEPVPTRDHTERLLRAFGARIDVAETPCGRAVTVTGGGRLAGVRVEVPGDPSSAAFPLVAALITPGSEVTVAGVLLNPLRNGLMETLADMGADMEVQDRRMLGGEEIGDVRARSSALRGVEIPLSRVAAMIDEMPILAVAAAFAHGTTLVRGAGELRVKESDRIAAIVALLRAAGSGVEEAADGFVVAGRQAGEPPPLGGARARVGGDHRIAMAALVMGLATRRPMEIDDGAMIATSFPGFGASMRALGAEIDVIGADGEAA